jgi:ion channel-forming bestrophin family protein
MAKSMRAITQQHQQQQQHSEVVHLALCLWVYARTMKRQLSHADDDEIAYRNEIYNAVQLPAMYRQQLILQVQHRPNYALQYLSEAIEDLSYIPNMRKNEIHSAVTIFEQCLGSNERILSSPIPLFYARWTARFLFLWLAFCPFTMYSDVINTTAFFATMRTMSSLSMALIFIRSLILIPIMYVISMFLFGIDEIAMQCEEPFSILPQQRYCDEIYNDCIEIANFDYNETNTIATAATTIDDNTIDPFSKDNSNNNAVNSAATEIGELSNDTIEAVPTS